MRRSSAPIIADLLAAIDGIEQATRGRSFEEFERDWLLKHGVQRGIEIISEACRHVPDWLLDQHPEIPWVKVRASGNVLRHEYFRVADAVIWSVVVDELPRLKAAVLAMRETLWRQVDPSPDPER